jgi:predicted GH43/DUF377 family glycosyl hydrolase
MPDHHLAIGDRGSIAPIAVVRSDVDLRPDARRVIIRPFLPDQQVRTDDGLVGRILALAEADVAAILSAARGKFEHRHANLDEILEAHFHFVARGADEFSGLSRDRRLVIGAYYSSEFSIESAALTNPSMVMHPDQSGLDPGAVRFILSLRAIGEGHLSAIEFRCGVVDARGSVSVDPPSRYAGTGMHQPTVFDKASFCEKLAEMRALDELTAQVVDPLPEVFELHQLDTAIAAVEGKRAPCRLSAMTTKAMHWLATSNYEVSFQPESDVSQRVIFPWSAIESHGLEDARFVRFVEADGSIVYYATYTAFDGTRVLPQLIETVDFVSFRIDTLSGGCAENKGAALFPRKIGGRYAALSRWDEQASYVMTSGNVRIWETAEKIAAPELPWGLARVGNCGSPLETEAGWLVITHGVGPFRVYSLGALLLDIDDPTRVIGRLDEPLLAPDEAGREGYVPNVVYSCGSMIHGGDLILPYGVSDTTTRIATVPVDELLERMTSS